MSTNDKTGEAMARLEAAHEREREKSRIYRPGEVLDVARQIAGELDAARSAVADTEALKYLDSLVTAFGPGEGLTLDQETWARARGHLVTLLKASRSSARPSEPMPRTFEYLLNAMEHAAQADKPSSLAYGAKRRAVFQHVQDLWDDYIRLLREKQDRLNAIPSASAPYFTEEDAKEAFKLWWKRWRKGVGLPAGEADTERAAAYEAWMHQWGEFCRHRFEGRAEGAAKSG